MGDETIDAHGSSFAATNYTFTGYGGSKITCTTNCLLIHINKTSIATAPTIAYLLDSSKNVLVSAAFVGNEATFTIANQMRSGTTYYIACDGAGSSIVHKATSPNPTFPVVGTYINWTQGLYNGGADSSIMSIESITTAVFPNSIVGDTGGFGTAAISKRYPIADGLSGAVETQKGHQEYLIAQESFIPERLKKGIN